MPSAVAAGDVVLYDPAPDWVIPAELEESLVADGPVRLLYDWQHRLETGVVRSYFDSAVRIDSPQHLMEQGTLTLNWMPDKGDLYVHRMEILRGGETIDLIANGAKFDVLRREQGLERRLLDGQLTATMAVPGLELGDVLRVSYTTTVSDQALGDEVQATQYLFDEELEVGFARAIVSWQDGADIHWDVEDRIQLAEPELRGGWRYLTADLPVAKAPEMPFDAPSRFHRPGLLRVGSFTDWQELSSVMAPHFDGAAELAEGSRAAGQAERIMRETVDPMERMAKAVRLVQDDVSYLLNGLDGGNYLPQGAEETWEKRYGDCKAKSVLLMGLLRHMGIEAEAVLVASRGGDALPELLPLPAAFDHMIVRARIDGTDFWLDGTSSGTRLSNIANVPAFHYALPLRAEGAGLEPMTQRVPQEPNMIMAAIMDHSAGVDMPYLFDMTMTVTGAQGAQMRTLTESGNRAMLRRMVSSMSSAARGNMRISAIGVTYNEEEAATTFIISGVGPSSFEWEEGRVVLADDSAPETAFNPDRARLPWRDIPVATNGPAWLQIESSVILPGEGTGFTLAGKQELSGEFAHTTIAREARLERGRLKVAADVKQMAGEIAPAELATHRLAARRLQNENVRIIAPADTAWRWDLDERERQVRAKPIIAAYDAAIDFAEEGDHGALAAKAAFLRDIYDFEAALAEFDLLIEKSPSSWAFWQRAGVQESLGRPDDAIADLEAAYDLDPGNGIAFHLARLMAYDGRADEARELLHSLPVGDDDRVGYADLQAMIAGLDGDHASGLDLLALEVAERPQNWAILNSDCWYRGLFNVGLDDALSQCTRAVERAGNTAPALDSRAMVRFRLGQFEEAIADLDAALAIAPSLAPSRYLRGVVRLAKGDNTGRSDIETALRMQPELAAFYTRHGVAPQR